MRHCPCSMITKRWSAWNYAVTFWTLHVVQLVRIFHGLILLGGSISNLIKWIYFNYYYFKGAVWHSMVIRFNFSFGQQGGLSSCARLQRSLMCCKNVSCLYILPNYKWTYLFFKCRIPPVKIDNSWLAASTLRHIRISRACRVPGYLLQVHLCRRWTKEQVRFIF